MNKEVRRLLKELKEVGGEIGLYGFTNSSQIGFWNSIERIANELEEAWK